MKDLRKNYLQSLYSKKKSCKTNGYEKNSCSQASRRLFSSWSELGGGLGEEQKGARSPALFSCHASPQSPVHNGKIAAAGPGKERRRQGTWLECMHSPKDIACTTGQ